MAIAKLLVECGALIEPTENANSPLCATLPAMQYDTNKHQQIFAFLLERGASILAKNHDGRTPLEMAIAYDAPCFIDLINRLTENGHDIKDIVDNEGSNVLHYAAKFDKVSHLNG